MPYMLKSKGTKQGLKSVLAAYGIPTSILRIQEYGGPKIGGEPDYEIKPSPWSHDLKVKNAIVLQYLIGVDIIRYS